MSGPQPSTRLLAAIALLCIALVGLLAALPSGATVVLAGDLRVSIQTRVSPVKLPRQGTAPISFYAAAHVSSVAGRTPPQLRRIDIQVNRLARLDFDGFPDCRISEVQPSTDAGALRTCRPAAIGGGHFWLNVVLPEQGTYPTQGRVLLFNGLFHHRSVLLAHVFTRDPFAMSFVLVFRLRKIHDGPYGIELSAGLPHALGNWGYVDRLKLSLQGSHRTNAGAKSFFEAGCPAPSGINVISYHLAYATLSFAGHRGAAQLNKTCVVKE